MGKTEVPFLDIWAPQTPCFQQKAGRWVAPREPEARGHRDRKTLEAWTHEWPNTLSLHTPKLPVTGSTRPKNCWKGHFWTLSRLIRRPSPTPPSTPPYGNAERDAPSLRVGWGNAQGKG